jgi:wobble nucleotide-excising tRNase
MYRQQRAQIQQSPEAKSATASESDTLNFWRNQVAKISERERKAISQCAEQQRRIAELEEQIKEIKTLLNLSIDVTLR